MTKTCPDCQAEVLSTSHRMGTMVEMQTVLAAELRKWWSFDDRQMHTHSWHSREDFIERKLPEWISALAATPAVGGESPSDADWKRAVECAFLCLHNVSITRAELDNAMQHAFGILALTPSNLNQEDQPEFDNPRDPFASPDRLPVGGEIQPHIYMPDYQAMGDCRVCGHEWDKPWHAFAAVPAGLEKHALRAAAERVCWFDWSDNDMDAVAVIDALRKVVTSTPPEQPALADVRWGVNVLLEKIAEKFENWDTHDVWRSDAATTVRGFKHDLSQSASPLLEREISFGYTNWRGETSHRRARPISMRYGTSEYHKRPGWLMLALDLDKNEQREFAMRDMVLVEPANEIALAQPTSPLQATAERVCVEPKQDGIVYPSLDSST